MKLTDALWLAIKLNKKSKENLINYLISQDLLTKYSQIHCDHVILEHGENITFEGLATLRNPVGLLHYETVIKQDKLCYLPVYTEFNNKPVNDAHVVLASDHTTPSDYRYIMNYMDRTNPIDYTKYKWKQDLGLNGRVVLYMKDGSIIERI